MDSITHALLIAGLLAAAGKTELIPFGILGAVIPDIDVAFKLFSDGSPDLYIFTHGGITHSIPGAAVTAMIFASIMFILLQAGLFKGVLQPVPLLLALAAALTGAMSHIFVDFLAYPGIPLLYPLSDNKMTMGILGGPSFLLVIVSIVYGGLLIYGKASISNPWPFLAIFAVVVLVFAGLKIAAALANQSVDVIPGMDPTKYIVVKEMPDTYDIYEYSFLNGRLNEKTYQKYDGVSASDMAGLDGPEYKRFKYHSYITVAQKNGTDIVWSDPLRAEGYIWYPPYFKSVTIPG